MLSDGENTPDDLKEAARRTSSAASAFSTSAAPAANHVGLGSVANAAGSAVPSIRERLERHKCDAARDIMSNSWDCFSQVVGKPGPRRNASSILVKYAASSVRRPALQAWAVALWPPRPSIPGPSSSFDSIRLLVLRVEERARPLPSPSAGAALDRGRPPTVCYSAGRVCRITSTPVRVAGQRNFQRLSRFIRQAVPRPCLGPEAALLFMSLSRKISGRRTRLAAVCRVDGLDRL